MFLGTTITGVLLASACALPIVISNRNRSKRIKRFFDQLNNFAAQHNGQIDQDDVWNATAIGVDKVKMKVFFVQVNSDAQIEREVDIKKVLQCRVEKKSRTISNNNDSIKVIERLDLYFVFTDKSTPDLSLPFYNNKRDNLSIDREFELVNKWAAVVNEVLDEHHTKSQRHF
ncbi:MAG: hypothetical protein KDC93_04625 [Cyclobacteriaceae bacterium]|nr:hypothetical protein [Cyclobacteriaceae bacterium]